MVVSYLIVSICIPASTMALTITKLQIESVPCSDSNRIRAHNRRQIHWSDDYKWVWPQVSRGRALKSFRVLLDKRRRLVKDVCIIQPLSMCSVSFLT